MSEWISVKDRLPEEGVDVLGLNTFNGLDKSFCEVIRYEDVVQDEEDDKEWVWFGREGDRWVRKAFGFWMPLPAPPTK